MNPKCGHCGYLQNTYLVTHVKFIYEESCLNKSTSKISKNTPLCLHCNSNVVEDSCHLLFECTGTKELRCELMILCQVR